MIEPLEGNRGEEVLREDWCHSRKDLRQLIPPSLPSVLGYKEKTQATTSPDSSYLARGRAGTQIQGPLPPPLPVCGHWGTETHLRDVLKERAVSALCSRVQTCQLYEITRNNANRMSPPSATPRKPASSLLATGVRMAATSVAGLSQTLQLACFSILVARCGLSDCCPQ
jgi:hypothetical protein